MPAPRRSGPTTLDLAWFVVACSAYFVAMHAAANGWASSGILSPSAAPGYWAAIDRAGLGGLARAPRGSGGGALGAIALAIAFAAMAASYGRLVLATLADAHGDAGDPRIGRWLGLVGVAAVPLLLAPQLLSTDVYSYIVYGRMASVHGANPYVHRPDALATDPFLPLTFWNDTTMVYGPVWLYVTAAMTWVLERLGASLGAHVLAFKLLALALHVGTALTIRAIARQLRPARATTAMVAYLFNPLCLIELVGNAHVDGLLVFLVLVGVHAHVRGRPVAAFAWLLLAALCKIQGLMFVGLYGLAWIRSAGSWRAACRRAALLGGLGATVVIAAYAPVWAGAATFDELLHGVPASRLLNSTAEALDRLGTGEAAARALTLTGFAIGAVVAIARARTPAIAVRMFPWLGLGFCALAATWFWPWYATLPVALAAAAGSRRALTVAIALSLTVLVVYVTFALGRPRGPLAAPIALWDRYRAVTVFGPPALLALALARRGRWRRASPAPAAPAPAPA